MTEAEENEGCVENWRTIDGWLAYEISDLGRVRRRGRLLKPYARNSGRTCKPHFVSLWRNGLVKQFRVAYLVLTTFVGPRPEGYFVRHFDDVQANNILSNLAWGTPKQNGEDSVKNGRIPRGSRHVQSVLTEKQVIKIRAEYVPYSRTNCARSLSERYGCSPGTISNVVTGRTWTHV